MTVSRSLIWLIETVNCPSSDGSPAESSVAAMESVATSSSAMVTMAELDVLSMPICGSPDVIPPIVTETSSSSSSRSLSITLTGITTAVCPAEIVTEAGRATKSSPATAEPDTIKFTIVSVSLALLSSNVNSPGSEGSAAVPSVGRMESSAVSSSAIVTVAMVAPSVTFESLVPVTVSVTVSLLSRMLSSITVTETTAVVSPARIVTLLGIEAKSTPSVDVPVISKSMVVSVELACVKLIVN